MLKRVTLLFLVFTLHSCKKNVSLEKHFAHEGCFLQKCQSTFTLGIPYPICGTDNIPYQNWVALDCSNVCAKKNGFEVRGDFEGLCPGKAVADEYWRMRQVMHNYPGLH